MKLLLVNTVAVGGSVGNFLSTIVAEAKRRDYEIAVAHGRGPDMEGVENIRIGNVADQLIHGLATRIKDKHGLESKFATKRFIEKVKKLDPDIIHLHNIHGYYLHYPTLFAGLKEISERNGCRIFWSLHDTWAFTGHCAWINNGSEECLKWKETCGNCPMLKHYPVSWWKDGSEYNFHLKKKIFNSLPNLVLLPASRWLERQIEDSFLSGNKHIALPPDVDIEIFSPHGEEKKARILGVAAKWSDMKGLDFFKKLRKILPDDVEIRLIGEISEKLPDGIVALGSIKETKRLAKEYAKAAVFVNPTRAEVYPMTNREALSCGTRVVTRETGGAIEDIDRPDLPVWSAKTDERLFEILFRMVPDLRLLNKITLESRDTRRKMTEIFGDKPRLKQLFDLYEDIIKIL